MSPFWPIFKKTTNPIETKNKSELKDYSTIAKEYNWGGSRPSAHESRMNQLILFPSSSELLTVVRGSEVEYGNQADVGYLSSDKMKGW